MIWKQFGQIDSFFFSDDSAAFEGILIEPVQCAVVNREAVANKAGRPMEKAVP